MELNGPSKSVPPPVLPHADPRGRVNAKRLASNLNFARSKGSASATRQRQLCALLSDLRAKSRFSSRADVSYDKLHFELEVLRAASFA